MKKNIMIAGLSALAIGFAIAYAATPSKPAVASAHITHVAIRDNKIVPDQVTIPVGQTVEFDTKDGLTHEIGLGEGDGDGHDHEHKGEYSSGAFGANQAWRVTFKQAGTFTFHDHMHPDINVLVVAYNPKK